MVLITVLIVYTDIVNGKIKCLSGDIKIEKEDNISKQICLLTEHIISKIYEDNKDLKIINVSHSTTLIN